MSLSKTAETAAQVTTPVPISVASATFMNITLKDWVLMGTALLIVFQLIVILPKAARTLRKAIRTVRRKE